MKERWKWEWKKKAQQLAGIEPTCSWLVGHCFNHLVSFQLIYLWNRYLVKWTSSIFLRKIGFNEKKRETWNQNQSKLILTFRKKFWLNFIFKIDSFFYSFVFSIFQGLWLAVGSCFCWQLAVALVDSWQLLWLTVGCCFGPCRAELNRRQKAIRTRSLRPYGHLRTKGILMLKSVL